MSYKNQFILPGIQFPRFPDHLPSPLQYSISFEPGEYEKVSLHVYLAVLFHLWLFIVLTTTVPFPRFLGFGQS